MGVHITDLDRAKDRNAMMVALLMKKLGDRPVEEVIKTILSAMSPNDREDVVVEICEVIR